MLRSELVLSFHSVIIWELNSRGAASHQVASVLFLRQGLYRALARLELQVHVFVLVCLGGCLHLISVSVCSLGCTKACSVAQAGLEPSVLLSAGVTGSYPQAKGSCIPLNCLITKEKVHVAPQCIQITFKIRRWTLTGELFAVDRFRASLKLNPQLTRLQWVVQSR